MNALNHRQDLSKTRVAIGEKVRRLREGRHLTQAKLAAELGISQGRLSELERGAGSFSAEQLLTLLAFFNVGASHFSPVQATREDALQNVLARLGASHLYESREIVADETAEDLPAVIRDVLVAGNNPRHLAGLAPILVLHADALNLPKLLLELREVGLAQRLGWLLDNVLAAIVKAREHAPSRPWANRYRRAETILRAFLADVGTGLAAARAAAPVDVLDAWIRSARSLREVQAEATEISRRWRVASELSPTDFAVALEAVR